MTDQQRAAAWTSSEEGVGAYDRTRPGYPEAALEWAMAGASISLSRGLDLGAGTGKLSDLLVSQGLSVVAVDPSAAMLAVLESRHPEVTCLVGTGEQLPLAEASVDLVVCGQAWHWMDPARAVREVARVLRPGGVFSLLWNLRDEREPWVAALGEAMENREDSSVSGRAWVPALGEAFVAMEHVVLSHSQLVRPALFVDFALSRSHVLTRAPEDRARLLAQVRLVAETHPDLVGRDEVAMPYSTVVWRARRQ